MKDSLEQSLQKMVKEKQEADERVKAAEDEARIALERVASAEDAAKSLRGRLEAMERKLAEAKETQLKTIEEIESKTSRLEIIQSQTVNLNSAIKMLEEKSESLKKAQKELMALGEKMDVNEAEKEKKFAELEAEITRTRELSIKREQEMASKLELLNQKSEKLRQLNAKQTKNE
ncbi:leucine zipper protein 1 [Tetranychus urticae]|uniref:Uncharacterized protein n=2 Tax=Tetranychus urticae TaxID=32264 RepID=T1KJ70_TETUR|nr:leucine zipper protein 1 [Tetranychus urticae]XP_015787341.1 leucine zipper protein 1 [Tetranychus urticae]